MLKAGIPIVISKAPPTYEAVKLSREYGVTVIGFARGLRFNVNSYPDRVRELRGLGKLVGLPASTTPSYYKFYIAT